jgi:hypothetical protein
MKLRLHPVPQPTLPWLTLPLDDFHDNSVSCLIRIDLRNGDPASPQGVCRLRVLFGKVALLAFVG